MTTQQPSAGIASAALTAGAGGWLLIGLLHPIARGGGDLPAQIAGLSSRLAAVHLLAIAAALALFFGSSAFSLRRGLGRSGVLAALVLYSLATCAFVGAAAVDGFIVPGIASAARPEADPAVTLELLRACGVTIQVLTKGGLLAGALAIGCWSVDLSRDVGRRRFVGQFGAVVALVEAAFVPAFARIDPHALVVAGVVQTLWYGALAALLASGAV